MRRMMTVLALTALAGCAASTPSYTGPVSAYPVFFQTWSAAIDENATTTIATAAKTALAAPMAPISVTGSADTVGSAQANIYLSKTRAQVVADALVADGVAQSRITVKAIGAQAAPGMANGTPAQFSRRVLISIGG